MFPKLFCRTAAAADVAGAHRSKVAWVDHADTASLTFSCPIEDMAARTERRAMLVIMRAGKLRPNPRLLVARSQAHRTVSDASTVRTRNDFPKALAMTAVESILAGRPLVNSTVVSAPKLLRTACEMAEPDDPRNHANTELRLALDPETRAMRKPASVALEDEVYGRARGLAPVSARVVLPAVEVAELSHPIEAR